VDLSGVWAKIPERCDEAAYARALDLWNLSGVQKMGAKLIAGIELLHVGDNFDVHFLVIISQAKITRTSSRMACTGMMCFTSCTSCHYLCA
jgi:hypothetical protein